MGGKLESGEDGPSQCFTELRFDQREWRSAWGGGGIGLKRAGSDKIESERRESNGFVGGSLNEGRVG